MQWRTENVTELVTPTRLAPKGTTPVAALVHPLPVYGLAVMPLWKIPKSVGHAVLPISTRPTTDMMLL